MIIGSVLPIDIPILNIYATQQSTKLHQAKLIELKEIETSTIIVDHFNILFLVIDRSWRQKISQYIINLISSIYQLDQIEFYVIFQPTSESIFFSSSPGTFIKVDYILSHKLHLHKLKKKQNSYQVPSQTTVELNQKIIVEKQLENLNYLEIDRIINNIWPKEQFQEK